LGGEVVGADDLLLAVVGVVGEDLDRRQQKAWKSAVAVLWRVASTPIRPTTVWLSRRVCSVTPVNLAVNEPETETRPRCRSESVLEPTSGSPVEVAPSILS
jgi:hypothetical protein